ncbi:flavodoxin family protein [Desulfohalovibrio reitneri]|uniref:flavodoxin family protein n=1 Tax=Desulfohalovibrio reitneri TaxID=1307759 RepID=UPI0004A6F9E2|nr:flavodoxin family protein [Desulfohalovibrio reitneri]
MEILGISASPRKNGNSDKILAAALEAAEGAGASTRAAHLRDYRFDSCTGCEKCRRDKICTCMVDGMTTLYPLFQEAKGLLLVTPVHTYNVTAMLKAFIDRLYCFYDFTNDRPRGWSSRLAGQNRKAALACIGEQAEEEDLGLAMPAMRLPLLSHDYEIVAELPVLNLFDAGRAAKHPEIMSQAADMGRKLAEALK